MPPVQLIFFCPAGHLSYRQMESVREVLRRVGTWDLVRLHGGEQLKGDYQCCQYIALNRRETDTLEFSRVKILSTDSLWALLGHVPQVSPLVLVLKCPHRLLLESDSVASNNNVKPNMSQQVAVVLYNTII